MLTWIFLTITLVCAGVVVFIIARKFPQMSNLDVASLPQEKQALKKKEIVEKVVAERSQAIGKHWRGRLEILRAGWGQVQLKFRIYVGKIERLLLREKIQKTIPPAQEEANSAQADDLVNQAEKFLITKQLDRAEEKYIAAIKADQKSVSAYRGLGEIYLINGNIEEARQTFQYVLRLEPDDDVVLVKLAEIAENQGDIEDAIQYYQRAVLINDSLAPRFFHLGELLNKIGQPEVAKEAIVQAVELEPKNPKYLSALAEIALLLQDKQTAKETWNELRLVNPDNSKLDDLLDRIDRI